MLRAKGTAREPSEERVAFTDGMPSFLVVAEFAVAFKGWFDPITVFSWPFPIRDRGGGALLMTVHAADPI
ncbi:MAG: hypothetical protein NVS9B14_03660 [Candidatus Acidiferrum sp.]